MARSSVKSDPRRSGHEREAITVICLAEAIERARAHPAQCAQRVFVRMQVIMQQFDYSDVLEAVTYYSTEDFVRIVLVPGTARWISVTLKLSIT